MCDSSEKSAVFTRGLIGSLVTSVQRQSAEGVCQQIQQHCLKYERRCKDATHTSYTVGTRG